MGGYSCQRKSNLTFTQVYGLWTLPTACLGKVFSDYTKNIIPEMFFGFYNSSGYGLDIGLIYDGSEKWKPVSYRSNTVYPSGSSGWVEGNSLSLANGETLYCKAWIEKLENKYYSLFNVSRTGYKDKDLLSEPYRWEVSSDFGRASGFYVNREIVIAANENAGNFTTSGCYLIDGKFLQHGLVTSDDYTYVWTDARSYAFSGDKKNEHLVEGADKRKILRLRDDNTSATINLGKISVSRTNSSSGATETVSIDFR